MNGRRCFCPACGVSFKSPRNLRVHKHRASMGELSKCNMLVVSKKPTGRRADANNDNYSTPEWAWRELFQAVPLLKKRRLWDPFYNDGLTTNSGSSWVSVTSYTSGNDCKSDQTVSRDGSHLRRRGLVECICTYVVRTYPYVSSP